MTDGKAVYLSWCDVFSLARAVAKQITAKSKKAKVVLYGMRSGGTFAAMAVQSELEKYRGVRAALTEESSEADWKIVDVLSTQHQTGDNTLSLLCVKDYEMAAAVSFPWDRL